MTDVTSSDRQTADALRWRELSRPVRNALSRLLGGGTLRSVAPETVRDLHRLGLIAGGDRFAQLSPAGWLLLSSSRTWLKADRAGEKLAG
jgi:hypothetical protein